MKKSFVIISLALLPISSVMAANFFTKSSFSTAESVLIDPSDTATYYYNVYDINAPTLEAFHCTFAAGDPGNGYAAPDYNALIPIEDQAQNCGPDNASYPPGIPTGNYAFLRSVLNLDCNTGNLDLTACRALGGAESDISIVNPAAAFLAIPTSTAPSLFLNITNTFSDPGFLKFLTVAGALSLIFYVSARIKGLFLQKHK